MRLEILMFIKNMLKREDILKTPSITWDLCSKKIKMFTRKKIQRLCLRMSSFWKKSMIKELNAMLWKATNQAEST
jgi:hypothetical protein